MFALNPDPKDDFQFMTCSKGTVKKTITSIQLLADDF